MTAYWRRLLEDLHWADSSTRELVAYLQQTLRGGRVLLLAGYRSAELHRSHPLRPWLAELGRRAQVERIELAPFHQAELASSWKRSGEPAYRQMQ